MEHQPGPLNALIFRSIVHDPLHADLAVELFREAGREEAIAEQPPRGIQNEHLELRFRYREAMGPNRLSQPADDRVEVLDIVHLLAVLMSQAIIDRFPSDTVWRFDSRLLSRRDDLRLVTDVAGVDRTESLYDVGLSVELPL